MQSNTHSLFSKCFSEVCTVQCWLNAHGTVWCKHHLSFVFKRFNPHIFWAVWIFIGFQVVVKKTVRQFPSLLKSLFTLHSFFFLGFFSPPYTYCLLSLVKFLYGTNTFFHEVLCQVCWCNLLTDDGLANSWTLHWPRPAGLGRCNPLPYLSEIQLTSKYSLYCTETPSDFTVPA
jgi:hypothetical protein